MKILLDENIDVSFAEELREFNVYTVNQMGWASKKNGELLGLAAENNFNIFITLDKNIKFQQNLTKFSLKFIVLNSKNSRIETLKQFLPKILSVIKDNTTKQLFELS